MIMVALVIFFPAMVMVYKDEAPTVDPSKVRIEIPASDLVIPPPPDFGGAGGAQEGGRPAPSGDPLQDQLNQQQQELDKEGADLQKQFGGK